MESIKINQEEKAYKIISIMFVTKHVLQIVFADLDNIPESYGDIAVFTTGGEQCSNLPGFSTVYRDEGQTVYLSDDGSIYTAPEDPGELPEEPYVPTPEELLASAQARKRSEVSADCEQTIYAGIDVDLPSGTTEHFSLTEHDQINLFGKQAQLAAGVSQLEYHADGQPCRYYSAADMQSIITAAMWHVSYHTTYCNALNMWIEGCETAEDVQEIFYGADVPEEYQSEVLKAYIKETAGNVSPEPGEENVDAETIET